MEEEVTRGQWCCARSTVNETCCTVRCHGSEGDWTVLGRAKDLSRCHEVKWREGERWLLMT